MKKILRNRVQDERIIKLFIIDKYQYIDKLITGVRGTSINDCMVQSVPPRREVVRVSHLFFYIIDKNTHIIYTQRTKI